MTAMVAVFFISCGTTAKVESSWRDPEAVVDLSRLNKVLVMALLNNETNRRSAETQLVGLLQNKGVASYQYFSGPLGKANEALIKQRLKRDGFDGALVMRLADVEKDINYVQTSSAGATRFWPYFWNSWGSYSNGYYETTKDASTNFFFDWLPKGTYVFEYPMFVTHAGTYSNGVTTIQCMYAPEFTSHSEGLRVNVEQ